MTTENDVETFAPKKEKNPKRVNAGKKSVESRKKKVELQRKETELLQKENNELKQITSSEAKAITDVTKDEEYSYEKYYFPIGVFIVFAIGSYLYIKVSPEVKVKEVKEIKKVKEIDPFDF